jgi:sulfotransferase family protein
VTRDRLPDFIIIGAMKAGTTTLWEHLRAHPQVFMPDLKELQFFSNPGRLNRDLDWYRAQFAGAGDAVVAGEASTNYTKHPRRPGTAERIAEVMPRARLIYLVRDPIERIRSHYLHVAHGHGERRPLPVAVRDDPEYLDVSRYRMQIDQYLPHFDASQLLVITSEDLREQRSATVEQVMRFIGVDPAASVARPATTDAHRSADKRVDTPLTTRVRRARGYETLRRFTPRAVRQLASRQLKKPLQAEVDATVPDDLRREIIDALAPDVARLREFLPAEFDGWDIA